MTFACRYCGCHSFAMRVGAVQEVDLRETEAGHLAVNDGGSLEVTRGDTSAVCRDCGAVYALPAEDGLPDPEAVATDGGR